MWQSSFIKQGPGSQCLFQHRPPRKNLDAISLYSTEHWRKVQKHDDTSSHEVISPDSLLFRYIVVELTRLVGSGVMRDQTHREHVAIICKTCSNFWGNVFWLFHQCWFRVKWRIPFRINPISPVVSFVFI